MDLCIGASLPKPPKRTRTGYSLPSFALEFRLTQQTTPPYSLNHQKAAEHLGNGAEPTALGLSLKSIVLHLSFVLVWRHSWGY